MRQSAQSRHWASCSNAAFAAHLTDIRLRCSISIGTQNQDSRLSLPSTVETWTYFWLTGVTATKHSCGFANELQKLDSLVTGTESDGKAYSALITDTNPKIANLALSWRTPRYSAEDGIGPMGSMHEAGSSLVAISKETPAGTTVIGSGVMVARGLLLTATHVLAEFRGLGFGPMCMSFLPRGPRVWLPYASTTVSGQSKYDPNHSVVSDISLVSCTLNSDPIPDEPLMLTPLRVALPLIGQRVWAFGFRHQAISENVPLVTPFVSSGRVSGAFPYGRGERMPSPCIEVDMDTLGGMSGGPVVNDKGELIGIVSSSWEGGPSYVTLIWDALRTTVDTPPGLFERFEEISLIGASKLRAARVLGEVQSKPWGDVIITFSEKESDLFEQSKTHFANDEALPKDPHRFTSAKVEDFAERYDEQLEDFVEQAAEAELLALPIATCLSFLRAGDVPASLVDSITQVTAEMMEGLEDFEIISIRDAGRGLLKLRCYFHLRAVAWNATLPRWAYDNLNKSSRDRFTWAQGYRDTVDLELVQRCVFQAEVGFKLATEAFSSFNFVWLGVRYRRK
ncbi:S1 family peptidase [Ruegeria pomeroyi]|uniref:S1 family peptidase n=1 Tax=Ruegeria pomeroyi TaxID=89184 RepID=UPI0031F40F10